MTSNAGEVKVNRKMPSDENGNDKMYYPDDCVGGVHMRQQMRQLGLEGKPEALCDFFNSISQQYDKVCRFVGVLVCLFVYAVTYVLFVCLRIGLFVLGFWFVCMLVYLFCLGGLWVCWCVYLLVCWGV